jgi:hypothetical protein
MEKLMNLLDLSPRIGSPLITGAAAVAALLMTASAADASMLWCGAGRGLTPEVAIQGAIDDAQSSASGSGQFTCELVGDPQVFGPFEDPYFGHIFRAQVTMSCN